MRRWFVVLMDTDDLMESTASAHEVSTQVVERVIDPVLCNMLRDMDRRDRRTSGSASPELAAAEAVARVVQRRA